MIDLRSDLQPAIYLLFLILHLHHTDPNQQTITRGNNISSDHEFSAEGCYLFIFYNSGMRLATVPQLVFRTPFLLLSMTSD